MSRTRENVRLNFPIFWFAKSTCVLEWKTAVAGPIRAHMERHSASFASGLKPNSAPSRWPLSYRTFVSALEAISASDGFPSRQRPRYGSLR